MPASTKGPQKPPKAKSSARRVGRPSSYSDNTAQAICNRLAAGESLTSICEDDDMPSRAAVLRWQRENPDFETEYVRAREAGVEARMDAIEEIAKDTLAGKIEPNAAKVAIGFEQWRASRLLSRVYGDKVEASVTASSSLIDLVNLAMAKRRESQMIEAQALDLTVSNGPPEGDKDKDKP